MSVQVAVRVRPLFEAEKNMDPLPETVIDVNEPEAQIFVALEKSFAFDYVFDSDANQATVYTCVRPIVQKYLRGQDATVFVHGQTGTGKSYTMGTHGEELATEEPGIIARVIDDVFKWLNNCEKENGPTLKASFLEIYNEQVFDLLNPTAKAVPLIIREDNYGFHLPDLTRTLITSPTEMNKLLDHGRHTRSVSSMTSNEASSRSHAIFTLTLETASVDPLTHDYHRQFSRLNLVDLAGSESIKRTQATGQTLKEGININKSLHALGNVIMLLGSKSSENNSYIPFRNSALTKILKDSFLGSGIILLIGCISPTEKDMNESVLTLRLIDRAKHMRKPPIPTCLDKENQRRKRKLASKIPPTPAAWKRGKANSFIGSATPSSYISRLNATSPGFSVPFIPPLATSTARRLANTSGSIENQHLLDLDNKSLASSSSDTSVIDDLKSVTSKLENCFNMFNSMLSVTNNETTTCNKLRFTEKTHFLRKSHSQNTHGLDGNDSDEQFIKDNQRKVLNERSVNNLSPGGFVDNCASPEFGLNKTKVDKTPSSSPTVPLSPASILKMETELGLSPNSTAFLETPIVCRTKRRAEQKSSQCFTVRRSTRRTTMMSTEITDMVCRSRIKAPGFVKNAVFKHPLDLNSPDRKTPKNREIQKETNRLVLTLLNTGNVKLLQGLGMVGPKTAQSIFVYRNLCQGFKSISDLKDLPGVSQSFYKRFLVHNHISEEFL